MCPKNWNIDIDSVYYSINDWDWETGHKLTVGFMSIWGVIHSHSGSIKCGLKNNAFEETC